MSRYEETRIFVLNDAQTRLCPALAMEIGFNESIIYLQLEYLIAIKGTVIDGRKWLRMPVRELELEFPYWSVPTVNRALLSLIKGKLLDEGNFNGRRYDKTRWFAINISEAKKLKSIAIKEAENEPLESRQPGSPRPELEGGHDTRSNQNDTGSTQDVTRSNQNETTIDRELNPENKSLENPPTPPSTPTHDTDQPQPGGGGGSRFTLMQNIEFARYRHSQGAKIVPDAVGRARFRDGLDDELIDEHIKRTPEVIAAERAQPANLNLFYGEALDKVLSLVSAGANPFTVIGEMALDDATRKRLEERFAGSVPAPAEART